MVFFLFLLLISSSIPWWSLKIFLNMSTFWNCWDFILQYIDFNKCSMYIWNEYELVINRCNVMCMATRSGLLIVLLISSISLLIFYFWLVLPAIEKDMLMPPTVMFIWTFSLFVLSILVWFILKQCYWVHREGVISSYWIAPFTIINCLS